MLALETATHSKDLKSGKSSATRSMQKKADDETELEQRDMKLDARNVRVAEFEARA